MSESASGIYFGRKINCFIQNPGKIAPDFHQPRLHRLPTALKALELFIFGSHFLFAFYEELTSTPALRFPDELYCVK